MARKPPSRPDKGANFEFFTLADAARLRGVSASTIRNEFDRGELRGVRASDGTRLIARECIEKGAPR